MDKLFTTLDRLHWLWLLLAAPFMLFPTPKRSLAMLVVPGLWVLHWLVTRRSLAKHPRRGTALSEAEEPHHREASLAQHTRRSAKEGCPEQSRRAAPLPITPLNSSLLLLSVMLLVSLWATYDIAFSLEKISGVVLGLGVFYAVVRIGQRPWGWALSFLIFLSAGVAVAAAGLLGVRWQVRFSVLAPIINRLPELLRGLPGAETGLQHNAVGGTLLWVLPCFLALSVAMLVSLRAPAKQSLSKTRHLLLWLLRVTLWLASLFVTAVLILTQSRGSYLALGLTAVVMLFIVLPPRWRLIFGFTLLLVGLTVVGALSRAGGWESLIDNLDLSDQSGLSINTLEGRLEIWSRAIYGIQDFPFTGMGMNTYREVVHVLYPLFLIAPDVDITHAHNEFLQAALDLGIPGLIAFVSIHIGAFWMLFDIWRKGKMTAFGPVEAFNVQTLNVKRTIILGLGGGLAAHMLFGITDAITLGAKPGLLWWMLLGLIAGLYGQTMPVETSASVE